MAISGRLRALDRNCGAQQRATEAVIGLKEPREWHGGRILRPILYEGRNGVRSAAPASSYDIAEVGRPRAAVNNGPTASSPAPTVTTSLAHTRLQRGVLVVPDRSGVRRPDRFDLPADRFLEIGRQVRL